MCNFVGTLSMRSLQICSVEIPYQGNLTDPARVPAVGPKPVPKLSQDCLIFAPFHAMIIICSILTPLLIPHSLMRLSALQHLMKTQFSKLWMSVGVYASTYLRSMVTLKYGTENASWVSTVTDSRETVTRFPHSWGIFPIINLFSQFSLMTNQAFLTINGKDYSHKQINFIREFFTDDQWDVIDYALNEYQDHDESYEIVKETLDVMGQVFRGAY